MNPIQTLAISALPYFLGLVVTLPILGHATWHLYRKLVAPEAAAQPTERVVNVAMEDQFRNRRETGAFRGDVVVVWWFVRPHVRLRQSLS